MFDFSDIIQELGIPLVIHIQSGNDNGHFEAGEWVSDPSTGTKEVNEPLLPSGSLFEPTANNSQESGGQLVLYDMYWYSEQSNIPMNTVVTDKNTGKDYKVANATPYTSYSTVTIYGMKRVEN